MSRFPKINVIVGGRQTGKTTLAKAMVKVSNRRRTLVLDTLDHPGWLHLDKTNDVRDLQRFQRGGLRIFGPMPSDLIHAVRHHIKNAFVVFEDARKFTGSKISKDMEALLIDCKQRGNDLLFMYHAYSLVPKSMSHYMDRLICLKTNILPDKSQRDRLGDIETVIQVAERVKAHSNRYYYETIVTES